MNKKLLSFLAICILSGAVLLGCRADAGEGETAADPPAVDEVSRPTSARGETPQALKDAMGYEGPWVFGLANNIDLSEPLIITGDVEKHSAGNWTGEYARKIGLYQNDSDRNLIGLFTLTAPRVEVNSPNMSFVGGDLDGEIAVVKADVYVNAPGFTLDDTKIEGDLIFSSQEYFDSANLETGMVTGETRVES